MHTYMHIYIHAYIHTYVRMPVFILIIGELIVQWHFIINVNLR